MELAFIAVVIVCPGFNGQCLPYELEESRTSSHAECVEIIPEIRKKIEYRIAEGVLPHDAFIHANVCEERR
jgi:hypothetical protein